MLRFRRILPPSFMFSIHFLCRSESPSSLCRIYPMLEDRSNGSNYICFCWGLFWRLVFLRLISPCSSSVGCRCFCRTSPKSYILSEQFLFTLCTRLEHNAVMKWNDSPNSKATPLLLPRRSSFFVLRRWNSSANTGCRETNSLVFSQCWIHSQVRCIAAHNIFSLFRSSIPPSLFLIFTLFMYSCDVTML